MKFFFKKIIVSSKKFLSPIPHFFFIQDNTTHTYIPDPSGRLSEDDIITIPYVTLMGSIKTLEQGSFLQKLAFNSLINIYKPNEFHNISIREFIFGYRDSFMDMLAKLESRYVPEDSGILSLKNGLMPFKLTVDTGLNDVENVGKVIAVNEKENMDIWKSDECNKYRLLLDNKFKL